MVASEKQAADSGKENGTTIADLPNLDDASGEIFKRMVMNDKKQNQRLSASLSKSANGHSLGSSSKGKDATRTNMRFIVCVLGLFSLSVSQMSRMILNQTIKDMVHPSMHKKDTSSGDTSISDGSCPWPDDPRFSVRDREPESTTSMFDPMLYRMTSDPSTEVYQPTEDSVVEFISDDFEDKPDSDFEPDSEITKPLPIITTTTSTSTPVNETVETIFVDKFYWDMKKQSILLGGFFYGYAFCMIPGE